MSGRTGGEAVFTTAMTGYQEVVTDPSYAGQIVAMTYPLIGNYGLEPGAEQAPRPRVAGFVCREACRNPNHPHAQERLSAYFERHGVVALEGVDTRALTRHLRYHGTMGACLSSADADPAELVAVARRVDLSGAVDLVTVEEPLELPGPGRTVAILDYGCKAGIVRELRLRGNRVVLLPARTKAREVLARRPAAVLLSNGPGDPAELSHAVETIGDLLGKAPVAGICLGHQLLARALGGETFKLKFGHRGVNHPVREEETGRVKITSQNHGYAVEAASLDGTGAVVTHRNLNDGTVEGLRHPDLGAFSIQYHPEASPGPLDEVGFFDRFQCFIEGGG